MTPDGRRPGPSWGFWVGLLNGVLVTAAVVALVWMVVW